MLLEQGAYVAQILGVLLIIASLVYVAVQVRQNTYAQLTASRQATMTAHLELLRMSMDYPEATEALGDSPEDIRFNTWLVMYLRITEFAWYQYQNRILDKISWESYAAPTAAVFEAERARRVWESNVIRLDPGFRAHIDQLIADAAKNQPI
jgi:hypothetical protein